MKWNRKFTVISSSFLFVIILSLTLVFVLVDFRGRKYVEHNPIYIWDDSDFETYNFPGQGTKQNPYKIQNYNITANREELIYISGTTKHFIIQNCFLKQEYPVENQKNVIGIYIEDAANNTVIIRNNIIDGERGMIVRNSGNVIIESNTIKIKEYHSYIIWRYHFFGIRLENCSRSMFKENSFESLVDGYDSNSLNLLIENSPYTTVENNTFSGCFLLRDSSSSSLIKDNLFALGEIRMYDSEKLIIENNNFVEESFLYIDTCPNTLITKNTITNGDCKIKYSPNSQITDNEIINGGFGIDDASIMVENNFVNNKEVGFFVDIFSLVIDADQFGQIIIIDSYYITIMNQEIANTLYGIYVVSSVFITISNNNLRFCDIGIFIFNSFNIEIEDNFLNESGIYFYGFDSYSTIANNIGYNSPISARGSFLTIVNNILRNPENNFIEFLNWNDQSFGIDVSGCNNAVQHNLVEYGNFGIIADAPQETIFYNNTCNLVETGLYLTTDPFFSAYNDTIDNNSLFASEVSLKIDSCEYLTISNNRMNTGISFLVGSLYRSDTFTVFNNTINGRLLGFYTDSQNLNILNPEFAALYLINCNNSIINNQIIEDKYGEIAVYHCDNITVMNNSLTNKNRITVENSINCNIKNNTLRNSTLLIYSSSNCSIVENSYSGSQNILYDHYSSDILHLTYSFDCTISNNSFVGSVYRGIFSKVSYNCTIKFNFIESNGLIGIYLDSNSANFTIHHNAFIDNSLEEDSQAIDNGLNNLWYDDILMEGNFWNNWISGTYPIAGIAGSLDLYPLPFNPL